MKMLYQMESQGDFSDELKQNFIDGYIVEDLTDTLNNEAWDKAVGAEKPKMLQASEVASAISKYLDMDYFNAVFEAYISHNNETDDLIESFSRGWKLERIAKVDLSILRLCITELKWMKDAGIPTAASISEAVRIAKIYGSDDSGKFVNGILGKIYREAADER